MDVTPDGNYLQMVVSRLAQYDITSATQETSSVSSSESYIFRWNGTDVGYTAYTTFPNFSLTANTLFQNYQYTFGYDLNGGAVFNPSDKVLSLQEVQSPLPGAVSSVGNLLAFMTPLYFGTAMESELFYFGPVDFEVGLGFWDMFFQVATGTETDVIRTPFMLPITNFGIGSSSNGYADNVFSSSKIYFSTLETSAAPTTKYKLYKWSSPTSSFAQADAMIDAIYQTQTQIFSKKVTVSEVRVYGEPWVANNSFQIDLIGSAGTPISGGSKTFTVGSNLTVGNDFAWYTPAIAPTYAIAVAITNKGTANHVINKIEIDYVEAGK